jgi:hypothetical protein
MFLSTEGRYFTDAQKVAEAVVRDGTQNTATSLSLAWLFADLLLLTSLRFSLRLVAFIGFSPLCCFFLSLILLAM